MSVPACRTGAMALGIASVIIEGNEGADGGPRQGKIKAMALSCGWSAILLCLHIGLWSFRLAPSRQHGAMRLLTR